MGQTWKVGDRIAGRWLVEQTLRGGMGEVYIVLDVDTQERLAAKTYRESVLATHQAVAHRFEREALTWIRLAPHPNVVTARFVRAVRGRPLLFLEFVPGGTLEGLMPALRPRSRFDPRLERVLELSLDFCAAMNHAVRHGVVAHRDIKPANCLLTGGPNPRLKVTDLGLAQALEDSSGGPGAEPNDGSAVCGACPAGLTVFRTRTGVAAGTPSHMPPEQFLDLKRADVRSDVYSFGVVLYQMLAGRLPFPGPTFQDFFEQHSWTAASPLPPLAAGLDQVVARCLEKDPERRFADFSELAEALAAAIPDLRTSYALLEEEDDHPATQMESPGTHDPLPEAAVRSGLAQMAGTMSEPVEVSIDLDGEWDFPSVLECEEDPTVLLEAARERITAGWEHALVLLRRGDWESAQVALLTITEFFPGFGRAWAERGNLLINALDRPADALTCLEEARRLGEVGLDEGIGRCQRKLAAELVEKARSLAQLKQTDQAFEALRRATVRFPEFGRAWGEMGMLLLGLPGRHAEALACLEEARRLGERGLDERIAEARARQG